MAELYRAGKLGHQIKQAFFRLDLGTNSYDAVHFGEGWSAAEPGRRWTLGEESSVKLPLPSEPAPWILRLDLHPFLVSTRLEAQRLSVLCSDIVVADYDVRGELMTEIEIEQSTLEAAAQDDWVTIRFLHPDVASPSDFGGADSRQLAMCFRKLDLAEVAASV